MYDFIIQKVIVKINLGELIVEQNIRFRRGIVKIQES